MENLKVCSTLLADTGRGCEGTYSEAGVRSGGHRDHVLGASCP